MHLSSTRLWQKPHSFVVIESSNETRTIWAAAITAVMMVAEIAAGLASGSMALLADGWHMGTHLAALGVAVFAYRFARRRSRDMSFAFGTGKVVVLGGFAGAVALAVIGLMMILESIARLVSPQTIHYSQALIVAVIGLVVNLACAAILGGHSHDHHHGHEDHNHGEDEKRNEDDHDHNHDHNHDQDHDHDHDHHYDHHHNGHEDHDREEDHSAAHLHKDHNIRAAYMHVLTDALTSVLAIIALLAARYLGWIWMDAAIGIVGGCVVGVWSWNLIRDTSPILLDRGPDPGLVEEIRRRIESDADNRVADLRVWPVGPDVYGATVSLVASAPRSPAHYASLLRDFPQIVHLTIEAHPCTTDGPSHSCCPPPTGAEPPPLRNGSMPSMPRLHNG